MTGVYSRPAEHWPKPENAMRALRGERPLCWSRPDFPRLTVVNSHRVYLADGSVRQEHTAIPNAMSRDCKAWAVREPDRDNPADLGENPATESVPGIEGWRCHGCRHLPNDPRVVERAQQAEAA